MNTVCTWLGWQFFLNIIKHRQGTRQQLKKESILTIYIYVKRVYFRAQGMPKKKLLGSVTGCIVAYIQWYNIKGYKTLQKLFLY